MYVLLEVLHYNIIYSYAKFVASLDMIHTAGGGEAGGGSLGDDA